MTRGKHNSLWRVSPGTESAGWPNPFFWLLSLLLLGYIAYLFAVNYYSTLALREENAIRFKLATEQQARTLEFALNEEMRKLRLLSARPELKVYFKNKALGMDMENGLRASLAEIGRLFGASLQNKGDDDRSSPGWTRILLLDSENRLLVDGDSVTPVSPSRQSSEIEQAKRWASMISSEHKFGAEKIQGIAYLTLSAPVFLHGSRTAQILAWFPFVNFFQNPEADQYRSIGHTVALFWPDDSSVVIDSSHTGSLAVLSNWMKKASNDSNLPSAAVQRIENAMVAKALVRGTPFTLITATPVENVYGTAPLWQPLLGAFATIVLLLLTLMNLVRYRHEKKHRKLKRKDGSLFPAKVTNHAFLNQRGETEGALMVSNGMAGLKEAENALKNSELTYRNIVENMQEVYYRADLQGKLIMCSPSGARFWGIDSTQPMKDLNIAETFYANPKDRENFLATLLEKGQVNGYELTLKKMDGMPITVMASSHLIYGEDGKPVGMEGIFSDITDRKRMEESLRQTKADLEKANFELTLAIRRANAMASRAEAASSAKSLFLANIGHEIRTPLNAITGMSHLALESDLPPRQRNYFLRIRDASQSLLSIVNNVLDYANVEAGRITLENEEFNLEDLLRQLTGPKSEAAFRKGLSFTVDPRPDIPDILIGDPRRLGQVLRHLVGNAIKFTEKGEIRLTICPVKREPGRVELAFAVTDTGIGIAPEQQKRIFDIFSQVDESFTRHFGGTGLGLALSKRLAETMAGDIVVESTLGKGSTFTFTAWFGCLAPARHSNVHGVPEGNRNSKEASSASAVKKSSRAFPWKNRFDCIRILLVEDNVVNRELAQELLLRTGAIVTSAENGEIALSKIVSDNFDMILMDVQMPVMDGLAATREIRRMKTVVRNVPIVALTANDAGEDRQTYLDAGMDDYISKPLKPEQLYRTVARWTGIADDSRTVPEDKSVRKIRHCFGPKSLDPSEDEMRRRLEGRFVDAYERAETDRSSFLQFALENPENLRRLAHDVKATAGLLGAHLLHKLAVAVEAGAKPDLPPDPELARQFVTELGFAVKRFRQMEAKTSSARPGLPENEKLRTGDMEMLMEILKRLEPEVRRLKPTRCKPLVTELTAREWPETIATDIYDICESIRRYKLKDALPIIEKLMRL